MPRSPSSTIAPPRLRDAVDGRVISTGDAGYDQARKVFYGGFDRRPAAIVRPADAAGVARVVRLAAQTGLELAVRGGGHNTAGHSTSDGGIVLDLSELTGIDVDPRAARPERRPGTPEHRQDLPRNQGDAAGCASRANGNQRAGGDTGVTRGAGRTLPTRASRSSNDPAGPGHALDTRGTATILGGWPPSAP